MTKFKRYGIAEFELAEQRYKIVTKKNTVNFMTWLGFHPLWTDSGGSYGYQRASLSVIIGLPVHTKMEMLLSDNWYALMRAHLVQNDNS